MTYVTFYPLCAIMTTSGPMLEHTNGRRYWNFMELNGTLRLGEKFRNFMELYRPNGSDRTEQLCPKALKIDVFDYPTIVSRLLSRKSPRMST